MRSPRSAVQSVWGRLTGSPGQEVEQEPAPPTREEIRVFLRHEPFNYIAGLEDKMKAAFKSDGPCRPATESDYLTLDLREAAAQAIRSMWHGAVAVSQLVEVQEKLERLHPEMDRFQS